MELSSEQRELLSAYIDGEITATERALALALLQRPEAAAYVHSMQRVKELARGYGAARAPEGFAATVRQALEGDFDSISRPTSNKRGDLHAMPATSWVTPLMAVAAAIVMALGLFVYNSLIAPETQQGTIAREHHKSVTPTPAQENERASDRAPAQDPASATTENVEESMKKTGKTGEKLDDKSEDEQYERGLGKGEEKNGPEGSDADVEKKRIADARTGGGKKEWAGDSKKDKEGMEGKEGKEGKEAHDETQHDNKSKPPSPTPPAESRKAARAAEVEEVEVTVKGDRESDSATLITDLLSVSALYGEAKAKGEGVEVEVSEEQLEEMLAALAKLTREQHRGSVQVAGDDDGEAGQEADRLARLRRAVAEKSKAEATGAAEGGAGGGSTGPSAARSDKSKNAKSRDYLPGEARDAVESPSTKKPADGAARPAENEKHKDDPKAEPAKAKPDAPALEKRKVKVIIKLKK